MFIKHQNIVLHCLLIHGDNNIEGENGLAWLHEVLTLDHEKNINA
jgi:hypothetical protein